MEETFEFTISFLLSESFDEFFLGFIAIVVNLAALFIESCTFKFLKVKHHSFDSIVRCGLFTFGLHNFSPLLFESFFYNFYLHATYQNAIFCVKSSVRLGFLIKYLLCSLIQVLQILTKNIPNLCLNFHIFPVFFEIIENKHMKMLCISKFNNMYHNLLTDTLKRLEQDIFSSNCRTYLI